MSFKVRQQEISFVLWGMILAFCALLGIGLGLTFSLANFDGNLIAPQVYIEEVEVGGQTPEQALAILSSKLNEQNLKEDLILNWQDQKWVLHPAQIDAKLELTKAIEKATQVGREDNFVANFFRRYLGWGERVDLTAEVKIDQQKLDSFLRKVSREVNREPVNAQMIIHPDDTIEVSGEKLGQKLNLEKTTALIKEHILSFERQIELPVETWKPEVTAETIHQKGIKRLISSVQSTFSTAKVNRTYNIKVAAQAIDGIILAPGDVFSFNKLVGPRSQEAGYKMAGVIVNNELTEGMGGGVCQVSSTVYNAALLANLEIVQRTNHSRPIGYFPLGRDATVAYDYLDLKFKNSTDKYVLIRAEVQGSKLLIRMFGDRPEGETVNIVTGNTSTVSAPVREILDSSLPAGTTVVEKPGGSGFKISVWRIVKLNGKETKRELISHDTYNAAPKVIRKGIGSSGHNNVKTPKSNQSPNKPPSSNQITAPQTPSNGGNQENQETIAN